MNRKSLPLFLTTCLLLASLFSMGQDFSGLRWYFGNSNRTIQFNRFDNSASVVTVPKPSLGLGGSAVVTDPTNGTLLFYTNGATIFDITNTPMPNGSGLTGNPAGNQPVVVAPVPGTPDQYFVITNSANFNSGGNIAMTVVNTAIVGNPSDAPIGDVDQTTFAKNSSVGSLTGQSEAMITIPHANGVDFWLITHTAGAPPTYNVTLFTQAGPTSTTTTSGLGLIELAGNFAYNSTLNQLAVSPQEINRDVEILNFDNASGTLSFETEIPNSDVSNLTTNAIYDVEWSNSGQYLYVSVAGEAGEQADLIQYDIKNPTFPPASVLPQPNSIDRSYGLIMAPDSSIYHLYENNGVVFLGKITDADTVAAQVQYVPQAFPGNFDGHQFPSFLPATDIIFTLDIEVQGLCANNPSTFYPTVTPPADSLVWEVDGARLSDDWSPIHTFDTPGPHSITVTAWLNGQSFPYTEQINITAFDTQITLVQDTTVCSAELPEPRKPGAIGCENGSGSPCFTLSATTSGTPPTNLSWFGPEGDLNNHTLTLAPRTPGYYYLVAEGANNCSAIAGVNIKEYDIPDMRSNIWYFGDGAGVDFNPIFKDPQEPIEATPAHAMTGIDAAPEGTSTISDQNGQVVFYTNGVSVWDRNNTLVAADIGGSLTSTQSSLIMPVQGDPSLYYIFTTQEVTEGTFELRYTVYDIRLNQGNGGIVDPDNDPSTNPPSTVLFTQSTERITAAGNWVIAHEYGNNTFRAYQVTTTGISSPAFSTIGSDHSISSTETGEGYMILSNGQLAVSLPGMVELFDFVDSSGLVTNYRPITGLPVGGEVYGIAFSPGGEKMYVTLKNHPNEIFEFFYDQPTDTYIIMPSGPIQMTGQPGAMQLGPDGQIYVAVQGANTLGSITVQTGSAVLSTFNATAVQGLAGAVTLGLPNFVQVVGNQVQTPGVSVTNVCVGTPTDFSASGKDPNIDKFDWTFNNGAKEVDLGPNVSRSFPVGQHTVSVTIYNKCEVIGTFTQTFQINDVPAAPLLLNGASDVLCPGPVRIIGSATVPDNSGNTYSWEPNGETSSFIDVTTPGLYIVTVTTPITPTSPTGCSIRAGQGVIQPFNNFTLGPDEIICQGAAKNITVNIGGVDFTWFVNGVQQPDPAPENVFPVNTSVPGTVTYSATITDGTCTMTDDVTFTIQPTPVFNAIGNNATCGLVPPNGSIDITIVSPPTPTSRYTISGGAVLIQKTNQASGLHNEPQIAAGVYTVTVDDQISGCAQAPQIVTVNNPAFTVSSTRRGTCFPLALDVVVTGGSGTFNYQLIGPNGLIDSGNGVNSVFFTNAVITASGSYTVNVVDANTTCQASSPLLPVNQDAGHQVSINLTDLCTTGQLTAVTVANDATTFSWTTSPAGGISTPTGNPVTINPGTWNVTVTASGGSACPGTITQPVIRPAPFAPGFEQSTPCANQVTLTASPNTPPGTYNYRWQQNNGPFIAGSNQKTATVDMDTYTLRVIHQQSGCALTFGPQTVRVIAPFSVSVTADPPIICAGQDFTLTAISAKTQPLTYQWSFQGSPIVPAQTGVTVTDNRAGAYEVIAFDDVCPSTPGTITISPEPIPSVKLGTLQRICPEGPAPKNAVTLAPISVSNHDPSIPFRWYLVDENGLETFQSTGPSFTAGAPGIYRIEVTSPNTCKNTDDVSVILYCEPVVEGPNAFRPTSTEESNQDFHLITKFIEEGEFQILIFNRWGEMVFESTDPEFRWFGTYKNAGPLLPSGTYAYVVKYKAEFQPEQGIKEKRGGVVLLR
jgi:large repetitive protein